MDDRDLDAYIAAADAAADAAGAAFRPYVRIGLAADLKSDESPVTAADRSAEQAARAVLAARFPDHGILGEEFGLQNAQSRWRWVVDPIDGTRAFITGRAQFGVLVALLDGARPVLCAIVSIESGWVWLIVRNRSRFFSVKTHAKLSVDGNQIFGSSGDGVSIV